MSYLNQHKINIDACKLNSPATIKQRVITKHKWYRQRTSNGLVQRKMYYDKGWKPYLHVILLLFRTNTNIFYGRN